MKVTDASTYRLLRTNLNRNETSLQDLYFQGTTGRKINSASDDPAVLQPILGSRNQITLAERYLTTMGVASDQMESTDGFLGSVENTLQRAKEISINGINASLSQADMNTLADEVQELSQQLLDTANSQIDGKYIFGGYSVTEQPYVENPDYDPALYDESDMSTWPVQYQGDSNRTNLEVDEGQYLETTITGNELFSGIENDDYADGVRGLSGQELASSNISPPAVGATGEIVIENGDVTTTISAAELVPTGDNYAKQLSGLLDGSTPLPVNDTGLRTNVTAATVDLGVAPTSGYEEFDLTFNSEGNTAVTIDLPITPGDTVSDEDIRSALADALDPLNPDATSGTFPNGVSFDTTGGKLVITGPENGADLEMTIQTTTLGPSSTTTTYGEVSMVPDTTIGITLSGDGLAETGLVAAGVTETTLSGSTSTDIFGVLANLEASLRAGNIDDPDGIGGGIQSNMEKLEMSADQNRLKRSQLGVRAGRVEDSISQQEGALIDLKATLSRYQDADITEILSSITQQETALQANLAIIGRVSSITILDYM